MRHEAILWEPLQREDKRVRCNLCSHRCVIPPGKLGACCVRENVDGRLYTLVYDRTISQNVDPIEKKPFFHFQPGTKAFSIATPGCNFRCAFCQNWEISQMPREGAMMGVPLKPADVAKAAKRHGCASVAYTYTEPTIFAEYALDCAAEAKALGLKNVFVSNGYMTPELIERMDGLIDGINVDLKAGRGEFYRRISGAALQPVLKNLKLLRQHDIWLEVTTLVIPGLNDTDEELRWVANYLRDEVGPDTPWHISRFFPQYEMADTPATPAHVLQRAYEIGKEMGLQYVYVGNLPGNQTESTFCPNCGTMVIERTGYWLGKRRLAGGKCASCRTAIAGVELN
ncbi:MAG: AmmeMemoRadiSam system radical SAM enzyme [Nitrososphaerales archaeon]